MQLIRSMVAAVVTVLACPGLLGLAIENKSGRPFTLQDAIEMSYIIDGTEVTAIEDRGGSPPGGAITAPDGKHFCIITQRGVIATNKLEATLWVFDRKDVLDYISKQSAMIPSPREITKMSATSNTPVISDVRWLDDSNRIAFLGKNDSPYQQLFIADLRSGAVKKVTESDAYVTSYDIRSGATAYTTLDQKLVNPQTSFVSVTGRSIHSLLFRPDPAQVEDLIGYWVNIIPSILHVDINGRKLTIPFIFNGKPLVGLFRPTISLSPDCKSLITIAAVHSVPAEWADYQPSSGADFLRLTPGNRFALADENPWKASQYVRVDLQSGLVSPLVNAPAGRSLVFGAPSKVLWFNDSHRAVLSSTYLPFAPKPEGREARWRNAPAVAVVDVSTGHIQPVTYVPQTVRLRDVLLDTTKNSVTASYANGGSQTGVPMFETFELRAGTWTKVPTPPEGSGDDEVELLISEDLNNPPVLSGRLRGGEAASTLWDPNPQLKNLNLGRVSLYRWHDQNGNERTGLLGLPADYVSGRQYPLVIQTYGYQLNKFFVDGAFTTGYGGRALAAKDIIVLQMDYLMNHEGSPEEPSDQIAGFVSAINQLSHDRLIDRHRVGIVGFSRTCFHVLYAITHQPDIFAAASITDGLDFGYVQYALSLDQANLQSLFERVNGGVPFGEGLRNWASNSPGFNLDKVKAPVLISALEKGELVYEWETYSGLRRLNKAVEMLWWWKENTPHILVQPAQRYASQQSAIDWFDFWLNGHEDPDPVKAEQYARWRELRKLQTKNEATHTSPKQ